MTALLLALVVSATPPPRDNLRFGVDYRWWGRNLKYTNAPASLATLSVGPEPTGTTFDVQWFPMSYFVDDARADLGLTVRADVAPESTLRAGDNTLRMSVARMRTGLMFRFPFEHVEPSMHLGFQAFEASARPGPFKETVPNVSLTGPRFGLGLRVLEFWRMTFDIGVGATVLLTTGELGMQTYFPGAKGNAFDGNIGLAFRTWPFLDIRLGVDVTVHSLTLGGGITATDAYYGISLGFIFKGVPLPGNHPPGQPTDQPLPGDRSAPRG